VLFGSLLLMVIGISLVFYFVTTPLERVLVWLYERIWPKAGYFAGRYALRGKGRNALISLMVVMSGVLPTLLATQLALQNANVETDTRFNNGAQLVASRAPLRGGFQFFRREAQTDIVLSADDVSAITGQPGIGKVVGVADNLPNMQVGDRILLRSSNVGLVGVEGDLSQVLYPTLFRWTEGDAGALAQIADDRGAVIISEGLSQALDLKRGDTLRVSGAGSDHYKELTIAGVAARIPGFSNQITRNSSDAARSVVLMHLDTYRELQNDPAKGPVDPDSRVVTKLFATVAPEFDEDTVLDDLRVFLGQKTSMSVTSAAEQVRQSRSALDQGRVFIVLLTGLSMVTAIFGVLAVMYTAVLSRRVEIGMLKAVGASKGALRGVFMGEAMITTLAAGVAGIIAGTILGYAFEASQRLQNDRPILPAFDFATAGIIVLLVSLAALLSAALATQPVIRKKAITILRER
jgi:ABC-type antimicrobial peptide transport system permease subunit